MDILALIGFIDIKKDSIKKYELGYPCMWGEVIGRIVGESPDGSWGQFNGEKMFSIPFFATPHGSLTKLGIAHLREITEDGLIKLKELEEDAIKNKFNLYAGKFNPISLTKDSKFIKNGITLGEVITILDEIRKYSDLYHFQKEFGDDFCIKYNIKSMQLNWLISVVAAERIKDKGIL